jgi:hypothetical protein
VTAPGFCITLLLILDVSSELFPLLAYQRLPNFVLMEATDKCNARGFDFAFCKSLFHSKADNFEIFIEHLMSKLRLLLAAVRFHRSQIARNY